MWWGFCSWARYCYHWLYGYCKSGKIYTYLLSDKEQILLPWSSLQTFSDCINWAIIYFWLSNSTDEIERCEESCNWLYHLSVWMAVKKKVTMHSSSQNKPWHIVVVVSQSLGSLAWALVVSETWRDLWMIFWWLPTGHVLTQLLPHPQPYRVTRTRMPISTHWTSASIPSM